MEQIRFICKSIQFFVSFGKSVDYFVVISINITFIFKKSLFIVMKTKFLCEHLYNYLHTLVKNMISQEVDVPGMVKSDIVICLLLSEVDLVRIPVLPLRLPRCLTLALQNPLHKLTSTRISALPNPKLKTLPSDFFISVKKIRI